MTRRLRHAAALLCSALTLFAVLQFSPLAGGRVVFEVTSSTSGPSQLFYYALDRSPSEGDAVWRQIAAGRSEVSFPIDALKHRIRWDPVDGPGRFNVHAIILEAGLRRFAVPLNAAEPNADFAQWSHSESGLLIETRPDAADPSIYFRLPLWKAVLAEQSLLAVAAVALTALLASSFYFNDRIERLIQRASAGFHVHRADATKFVFLLFVALVCYFYELAAFSLSIDDEFAAWRDSPEVWIAQGRWTVFLLERWVLPQPVLPFFPTFLFCLLISLSYVLLLNAHRIVSWWSAILLFPLFCTFPIWLFIAEFYSNLPSAGFGILLLSLAALIYRIAAIDPPAPNRGREWKSSACLFIAQVIFVATAVGTYQSFLLAFASIGLGIIVLNPRLHEKRGIRTLYLQMVYLLAVLLCSGVTYVALSETMKGMAGVETHYVDGFVKPEVFFAEPVAVALRTLAFAGQVYGGSASIYGVGLASVGLVVGLGLLALLLRKGDIIVTAAMVLFAVAALLAPFALYALAGAGYMSLPLRAFVGVPYAVWLTACLAIGSRLAVARLLGLAAIALATFQVLYTSNLYQASRSLVREQDRMLAAAIYDRLAEIIPEFDPRSPYRVDFFGAKSPSTIYPKVVTTVIGSSFFDWDGGNPYRIVSYMRLIGFENLVTLEKTDRLGYLEAYARMPIWPAKGSMRIVDDVVLVKLGDAPGLTHQIR